MLTFYVAIWGSSWVGSVFGNDRSACARPYIQYCYPNILRKACLLIYP